MDINGIFNDFAKTFEKKINKDYKIRLQFEIYDMENEIWQIDVNNGNVIVSNKNIIKPEEILVLSKDTLIKLYNNELAPLTAFAQEPNEKGEYCALIDMKDKKAANNKYPTNKQVGEEKYREGAEFLNRFSKFFYFFSKDYPTKIIVDKNNGIKLHNVNGIGFLSTGVIHAYFSIKKDEVLDESGYEFSIYVIKGNGIMEIENEEYNIEEKCYYHLPAKNNVYIKNRKEEILEIIYLSHY